MKNLEANNEKQDVISPWVEEQLNSLSQSLPQFKSKAEAIDSLTVELDHIAKSRSLHTTELLKLAVSSHENHQDLDRALRLASVIFALKK